MAVKWSEPPHLWRHRGGYAENVFLRMMNRAGAFSRQRSFEVIPAARYGAAFGVFHAGKPEGGIPYIRPLFWNGG